MNNNNLNKDTATQRDSLSELLGQLVHHSASVVHNEIELVKRGILEKAKVAQRGVLTVLAGALAGFGAFLCFTAAAIIVLTSYMSLCMAALVTGTALAFIGVLIAFIGYKQVKKSIPGT